MCVCPAAQALSGCGHPKCPPRPSHVLFPRVRREGGRLPRGSHAARGPGAAGGGAGESRRLSTRALGMFLQQVSLLQESRGGGVHRFCCKHLPARHLPCVALGMLDSEAPVPSAQGERGSGGGLSKRDKQLM